jgi:hypothetical protein
MGWAFGSERRGNWDNALGRAATAFIILGDEGGLEKD